MPRAANKHASTVSIQNLPKPLSLLFRLCQSSLPLLKRLHAQIVISGLHSTVFLGSKLADCYIELGSLGEAHQVFDQIPQKNPHSWNTIISGYSKYKHFLEVLSLYLRMRSENHPIAPDSFNLVFAIKACTGLALLEQGRSVHSDAVKVGLASDPYVGPGLMLMYVELGCLDSAKKLFDEMPEKNSVAWGAMINGYTKFSKESEAFELFVRMRRLGFELDPFTAVGLVRACGNACAGREGIVFHGYCVKRKPFSCNVWLKTFIADMYVKCGHLDNARKVFDEISERNVVLWNAMIAGFSQHGRASEALNFFRQMLDGVMPNAFTVASVLLACLHLRALQQGKSVHGYVVRNGVELDVVTYTAFVDMYAKCGSIIAAYKIFDEIPHRNVYSWSVMINGFGMHGLCSEALALFTRMTSENQKPNSITFTSVLSACSHSGRVEQGWEIFNSMTRDYGINPEEEHYACMVDLLGRVGQFDEALSLIECMPMEPNASIWAALLGACGIHMRIRLADQVAKKLIVIAPDQPDAYVLLSNIYANAGMWDRVNKLRTMICRKGLKKTIGYSSIEIHKAIHSFSAFGRLTHIN